MSLINWIKASGIRLTDLVNKVHDPFDEFTRAPMPKYPETLEAKAAKFEADLDEFYINGVMQYNIPVNSGDQALWHGVATAMYALRASLDDSKMFHLERCIKGLMLHQSPTGESTPRLVRGYRLDGSYEDEVSNDQVSGHLLGIYFLWRYGNETCQNAAKQLIKGLADELINNKWAFINANGTATKFGKLINGVKTDPLRLTLCLAVLKVAHELTNNKTYEDHYRKLAKKYFSIIPFAKVKLLWIDKNYDSHRAAIHYSILCFLENDPNLHNQYIDGLLRTWTIEKKSANPWIYYLVRRVVNVDPEYLERAIKHLDEFTLEDKQYNFKKVNPEMPAGVRRIKWGKHDRASQPLPRWKVGSQDFFWQRNMFSVDDWPRNAEHADVRHNGLDFLIAYYGLKSLRLI